MTRLWSKAAAIAVAALACGGCSFSMQLDDLAKSEGKGDVTGSIKRASDDLPPEGDLVFTRAAVSEVFTRGAKDTAVPWENPSSGARGTVTALASSDGAACRDFLASYVRKDSESWMQGEACRASAGVWEVRSLKPWKRT